MTLLKTYRVTAQISFIIMTVYSVTQGLDTETETTTYPIWPWVLKSATLFFKPFLSILLLLVCCLGSIRTNGQNSFSFLILPNNARLNALGGVNASLFDKDINLHTVNPALLDSS